MITIQLDDAERTVLAKALRGQGGFQDFMKSLRQRAAIAGKLTLSDAEIDKIARYALDYGNGGWEDRLREIFERHLGSKLGR